MISAWIVWLIAVVDNVRVIIGIIAAFLFVAAIFTVIRNINHNDDIVHRMCDGKKIPITNGAKGFTAASMIIAMFAAMIPTQKGLAAIVLVPAVLNDTRIQNITGNSLEALEALTRKWMLEVIKDDAHQKEM